MSNPKFVVRKVGSYLVAESDCSSTWLNDVRKAIRFSQSTAEGRAFKYECDFVPAPQEAS